MLRESITVLLANTQAAQARFARKRRDRYCIWSLKTRSLARKCHSQGLGLKGTASNGIRASSGV